MASQPNIAPDASSSSFISDVSVQNFMQEVIQASLQIPVLVYFTAPWCAPCKQYGPLLEKVVNAAKGKVKLARVDIDKNPQLAQQFRIQSVPMVYIFLQGQPLDGFAGAMPESQLKQIIEQVAGAGPEGELIKVTLETAAGFLAESAFKEAEQAYQAILAEDEGNVEALAGLVRCFIGQGALQEAEDLFATLPEDKQSTESLIAAKAALALAKSAPKATNLDALRGRIAAAPLDHQARFDLATALFAGGEQQQAVDELLTIVTRDKNWNEGAARAQLLIFFEALGFTSPIAVQGRRKLSSLLFA